MRMRGKTILIPQHELRIQVTSMWTLGLVLIEFRSAVSRIE